jgi:magnesium chelatase subunit D
VSETALAAARRVRSRSRFRVTPADIRVVERRRTRPVDLCLLLDASASMEGSRMRAAKTLARHLLLTGRERVAVMAFQERSASLAVPLTRNYAAAERGLARVVPAGLTPLAAGLQAARTYLSRAHARNPLLLLVTDGIPTVGLGAGSPLDEALEEADRLRSTGFALCCIGLEPNERYLGELARRAGGRLHVVPELRPELLAAVARRERLRRLEDA